MRLVGAGWRPPAIAAHTNRAPQTITKWIRAELAAAGKRYAVAHAGSKFPAGELERPAAAPDEPLPVLRARPRYFITYRRAGDQALVEARERLICERYPIVRSLRRVARLLVPTRGLEPRTY